MLRDDLSDRLIHLTRGKSATAAEDNFISILCDRSLRGSGRDIRGGFKCVCFSEAPLAKISLMLALPSQLGCRYHPFGVMVGKTWLFERGGRPVIYQSESEYSILADEIKYRHVRYEPHRGIDYSWEREWRVQTDVLDLEPDATTLIVPTREWAKQIRDRWNFEDSRAKTLFGIREMLPLEPFPWHFIALEDLGFPIRYEDEV
ncbi:hypothetical protein EWI61_03940 [Methylolobus aquaticus]|nr:hypothetical protein EWI61_03940 [Methylolobus aquaticus]